MDFDVDKTISYWQEGAEYDIGVAEVLLQAGKYPYALFMGHLALEKLLKAIVVKNTHAQAPITHSLPFLAEKSMIPMPKTILVKLREFMEFYSETRYPREDRAFYTKCNKVYTKGKLNEVKKTYKWLKDQLSKL